MSKPTVAILGASKNRNKYGNKSVRAHLAQGYDVYPINPAADEIEGLKVYKKLADIPVERLDRISIYLSPAVGLQMLEEIAAVGAKEVFFNPGAESEELLAKARELGIDPIQACSIVDVGMSPRELEEE
ncbi:CoA-binding protein [Blastopirellula sp. JC732]|uniref:CoA-binding protein n=1 Tax=Blastopirellula sediminis TaxID=2894196 RepID=A0A9X1MPF4_9BACT|nr:CoA-binding protein [Blastopirellula sediminis]MCC9606288.1 CoA-binding protein [Blastopirellula sediminis]MCC9630414.1 CoA-binding protein [Blastopirellula sediminis]